MGQGKAIELIEAYYDAFNRQDMIAFFDLLDEEVQHDVNEGIRESGKTAFRFFMEKMNRSYEEQISDVTIMATSDGARASAEYVVTGRYLESEFGLPEADGQPYTLRAGAFFEIKEGLISRVTNYYNLADWTSQIETGHSL